ncbi:MAG: hypothetical protein NDJ89_17635 [Oligoflexia bacterium]|nr:hypothetical protein [Oligoflexia bacterium]
MRKIRFWVGLFAAAAVGAPAWVQADDVYTIVVKKQEAKAQKRWSLSEWLETKEKIRLMDMWLALHTPSPFEFSLGADYRTGNSPSGSFTGWSGSFAAYASIFGLEAQYEDSAARTFRGLFHLRIFGYSDQATQITLQTGLISRDGARAALAGVRTNIYLARFFGIEGLFRHVFESASGASLGGKRFEAGAFIDFDFVRVTGSYFSEPSSALSGASLGTRLYF